MRDGRIVGGGQRIGLGRQLLAKFEGRPTVGTELLEQGGIIGGIRDDRDMGVVLGRGAHHRRPADVDILDDRVAVGAAHDRVEERVEVDHDEVDRGDTVLLHRRGMLGVVAHAQEAAVNLRMERLYPPVHHLGEAGEVGNVADCDAQLAQPRGGAAGRDDVDAMPREPGRQLLEPRFIGKRN